MYIKKLNIWRLLIRGQKSTREKWYVRMFKGEMYTGDLLVSIDLFLAQKVCFRTYEKLLLVCYSIGIKISVKLLEILPVRPNSECHLKAAQFENRTYFYHRITRLFLYFSYHVYLIAEHITNWIKKLTSYLMLTKSNFAVFLRFDRLFGPIIIT